MTTAELSTTEDNTDLHFTDQLALVAYDLKQVAIWLDGHRDEWDAADLGRPGVSGHGALIRLLVFCWNAEQLAAVARILADRAPLGAVEKDQDDDYARVTRRFGTVFVEAYAQRETVCERIEVGTETVEVPDPDAPKVTIERPVYEWRCAPLLEG